MAVARDSVFVFVLDVVLVWVLDVVLVWLLLLEPDNPNMSPRLASEEEEEVLDVVLVTDVDFDMVFAALWICSTLELDVKA